MHRSLTFAPKVKDITEKNQERKKIKHKMPQTLQIDSVILGWKYPLSWAINQIIRKYYPPPATIIDLTAGKQLMHKSLFNQTLENNETYKMVFGDIRRLERCHFQADVKKIPLKKNSGDIILFDPPYQSPNNRHQKWRKFEQDDRMAKFYGFIEQRDLELMFKRVNEEFYRILKPNGIIVAKIMDRHENGLFYPNHIILTNKFTNFILHDVIIYRFIWARKRIPMPYAAKHHSYIMVFKKLEGIDA